MGKHLLRLVIAYFAFEMFRQLGRELPALFSGESAFAWIQKKNELAFFLTGFFIFQLYPLTAFIIFQKFYRNSRQKAIVYFLLSAFSIISFRYLIEEILFLHWFGFHNYFDGVPLLFYYADNIYYAVLYSAFGILYFFLQNEQRRIVENHELQLQNRQAQLLFLKSQINPHFLFNNLNNIYSLVYQQSPQSLQAIAKLSDILRYMLYEDHEHVTLSTELGYIGKYIDLQQLRFDKPVSIEKETSGDIDNVFIPPLTLIPFVENAFKHGDFKNGNVHLKMKLMVSDKIEFYISNKKAIKEKDATGGIGLQNIRKRLALLYPEQHHLTIDDSKNIFTVNLQLAIK